MQLKNLKDLNNINMPTLFTIEILSVKKCDRPGDIQVHYIQVHYRYSLFGQPSKQGMVVVSSKKDPVMEITNLITTAYAWRVNGDSSEKITWEDISTSIHNKTLEE